MQQKEDGVRGPGGWLQLRPRTTLGREQVRPRSGPQGPVSGSPASAGVLLDVFILLLLFSHQVVSDSLQAHGL